MLAMVTFFCPNDGRISFMAKPPSKHAVHTLCPPKKIVKLSSHNFLMFFFSFEMDVRICFLYFLTNYVEKTMYLECENAVVSKE